MPSRCIASSASKKSHRTATIHSRVRCTWSSDCEQKSAGPSLPVMGCSGPYLAGTRDLVEMGLGNWRSWARVRSYTRSVSPGAVPLGERHPMKAFCALCLALFFALSAFAADGKPVTYKSGDETVQGVLYTPPGKGPFPALVVVHEWWGL